MSTMTPRTEDDPSSPEDHFDGPGNSPGAEGSKKRKLNTGRTSQACTRCRSLKMKCIGATDPPDVTSRLKELEHANARFESLIAKLQQGGGGGGVTVGAPSPAAPGLGGVAAASRSGALNLDLGLDDEAPDNAPATSDGERIPSDCRGVFEALERLKDELPASLTRSDAWAPSAVARLWESFRSNMPGLHFLSGSPGQVSFSNPSPLLAVSILYVAAAHSPLAELAAHQPTYFRALTRAIGTLAVPDCPIRGLSKDDGEGNIISGRFDDLLGIILAGLLGVGFVDSLGMWVNTAFRLLLDGMTEERGKRQVEWHGLWEGLRTIELEHSSLHLICPALPRNPPNPPFSPVDPTPQKDAAGSIGELLAIMQRRMPQFVGRGLPTVWDTVCDPERQQLLPISTGRDDMSAIRAWAGEIDAWYSHVATETTGSSLYVRAIILLNYHLHKLFVLSIFFPLQGVASSSVSDQAELLESSRVVLRIEASGFEVWSSWDLVMITNASLILLQAWAAGAAGQEDLNLIQHHLNLLTCTQQTPPSLRHTLATRLETALQQVRTPVRQAAKTLPGESPNQTVSEIVDTWQLQASSNERANNSGRFSPSRSGYLFMDQAPNLGILPELPSFNVPEADWPPFLLNFFGDQEAQNGGQQFQQGGQTDQLQQQQQYPPQGPPQQQTQHRQQQHSHHQGPTQLPQRHGQIQGQVHQAHGGHGGHGPVHGQHVHQQGQMSQGYGQTNGVIHGPVH